MSAAPALDWSSIDTVLLDMDGTLLDLRFDNWFWHELIPRHYAAAQGFSARKSRKLLQHKFGKVMGTMSWYCIDYWSQELGLDIAGIKRAARAQVRFLPGAQEFLVRLSATGKRRILITNAHPVTLAIKADQVALQQHFDASYSTHTFCAPKEDAAFWPRLLATEPFEPQRTLIVDDSLVVLDSARDFGIACLRAIRCPDSGRGPQNTADYASVDGVADLT